MKHKHTFKITGQGCYLGKTDNELARRFPCDIDYECECREKFRLRTTVTGNRSLPSKFETEKQDEIRKFLNEEIDDNLITPTQHNT